MSIFIPILFFLLLVGIFLLVALFLFVSQVFNGLLRIPVLFLNKLKRWFGSPWSKKPSRREKKVHFDKSSAIDAEYEDVV